MNKCKKCKEELCENKCLFCGWSEEEESKQIEIQEEIKKDTRYYTEEEVIQAFQETVSRIGGQHSELSDMAYLKLLLDAKYKKRCQVNQ